LWCAQISIKRLSKVKHKCRKNFHYVSTVSLKFSIEQEVVWAYVEEYDRTIIGYTVVNQIAAAWDTIT